MGPAWDWHFVILCLAYFLWGEVWPAFIFIYMRERDSERERESNTPQGILYIGWGFGPPRYVATLMYSFFRFFIRVQQCDFRRDVFWKRAPAMQHCRMEILARLGIVAAIEAFPLAFIPRVSWGPRGLVLNSSEFWSPWLPGILARH